MAELWAYIAAESSEHIATRFVQGIAAVFETPRYHPRLGAARHALAPGLRVLFHRDYAIYYLPRPEEVVIVRVLHGARDLAAFRDALRQGVLDADDT